MARLYRRSRFLSSILKEVAKIFFSNFLIFIQNFIITNKNGFWVIPLKNKNLHKNISFDPMFFEGCVIVNGQYHDPLILLVKRH